MREHIGRRGLVLLPEVTAMRSPVSRGMAVLFVAVCVLLTTTVLAAAAFEFWFGPPPADWEKNVVQIIRVMHSSTPGARLTYLQG